MGMIYSTEVDSGVTLIP